MKKKVLCLVLALTLSLAMTAGFALAYDGADTADLEPKSTGSVGFSCKRISNTKAAASVNVEFTKRADDYTVTLTLQKKSGGSWVTATDVPRNTIKYVGSNKDGVLTYDEWTVKKGVVYRLKCVSVDSYDIGIKYSSTNYSDPF